ncbi:hypothetical protein RZS08_21735, partial [Arthrospira platensis SPKY1]|nr:hypothetical protein [Arthrospira platensis SPKY1]
REGVPAGPPTGADEGATSPDLRGVPEETAPVIEAPAQATEEQPKETTPPPAQEAASVASEEETEGETPPESAERSEGEIPPPPEGAKRHRFSGEDAPVKLGKRARARRNIEALKVRNTLREENRQPTPEERKILGGWTGWGALPE